MSRLKVLVADDHPLFVESVASLLAAQPGVQVVGLARSGEEALALCESLRPDVVLLDVAMPGIGGLGAAEALKQKADSPKVVLITLYDDPEYRERAQEIGVDGFVNKIEFAAVIGPILGEMAASIAP